MGGGLKDSLDLFVHVDFRIVSVILSCIKKAFL